MLNVTDYTIKPAPISSWIWGEGSETSSRKKAIARKAPQKAFDPLQPLRTWLGNFEIKDPQIAHHLCFLIPAQCPFERDVKLFGRVLFHIPPMCKLNPLYEEFVMLRFRALCYLADECGEDISAYC